MNMIASATGKFLLKSFKDEITKEINSHKKEKIKTTAIYLRDKIKDKIKVKRRSSPGEYPGKKSGDLLKGIKYKIKDEDSAFVGAGHPAQHAHLMEFGTMERNKKDGKATGRVLRRPFILPTFEEEKENIKSMMSKPWF